MTAPNIVCWYVKFKMCWALEKALQVLWMIQLQHNHFFPSVSFQQNLIFTWVTPTKVFQFTMLLQQAPISLIFLGSLLVHQRNAFLNDCACIFSHIFGLLYHNYPFLSCRYLTQQSTDVFLIYSHRDNKGTNEKRWKEMEKRCNLPYLALAYTDKNLQQLQKKRTKTAKLLAFLTWSLWVN